MADITVNEQIDECIQGLKNSLLTLISDIDEWFETLKEMAKLLKSKVPIDKYQKAVKGLEDKIQDLYDEIVALEDEVDETLAKSWLGKAMDFENLLGELFVQTQYVGEDVRNIGEGCIPQYEKIVIPHSWRDLKKTFSKESDTF